MHAGMIVMSQVTHDERTKAYYEMYYTICITDNVYTRMYSLGLTSGFFLTLTNRSKVCSHRYYVASINKEMQVLRSQSQHVQRSGGSDVVT
jgi:hypothetical protein